MPTEAEKKASEMQAKLAADKAKAEQAQAERQPAAKEVEVDVPPKTNEGGDEEDSEETDEAETNGKRAQGTITRDAAGNFYDAKGAQIKKG